MNMPGRKNEQSIYTTTQNAMCKLLKGLLYFAASKKWSFIDPDHIWLTLENNVRNLVISSWNHRYLNE